MKLCAECHQDCCQSSDAFKGVCEQCGETRAVSVCVGARRAAFENERRRREQREDDAISPLPSSGMFDSAPNPSYDPPAYDPPSVPDPSPDYDFGGGGGFSGGGSSDSF